MKKLLLTILVSLMWCSISIAETKYYPNGDEYTGEFKDGKRDGKGKLTYHAFQIYDGEFKDDKRHGQGTFMDEGLIGLTYIGQWKDDKKSGLGVIKYKNGLKYSGYWKDDKENGEGILTLPNGKSYVGEFKDGVASFEDNKPLVYDNNEIFYGKYKDGKKHGQGTLVLVRGGKFSGKWEDGKLIETDPTETVYVGVGVEKITTDIAKDKKLGNTEGALIFNVKRNSPADKAGLQTGDIILNFDGKKIDTSEDLKKIISNSPINKTVEIVIWRNEKKMSGKVTLARLESLGSIYASKLLQKGHTLNRNGYLDGAILYYKKTLEADPEYKPAINSLESALQEYNVKSVIKLIDPVCQNTSDDFKIIKFCLDKHFFYQKYPIHPELISDFIPGYADSGDIIISINLTDAFGTNQYSLLDKYETELKEGRSVVSIDDPDGNGYFVYNYLGSTDNGAMVLMTYSSGGGSGIFPELLIIKVKKRLGANHDLFNSEGVVLDKQQVVLEKLLSISLGDRTENSIAINGNTVSVNDKSIKIPSY